MKNFTACMLLAMFFFKTAFAANYFVSPTGKDQNNGKSEAKAFRTIQKGADIAEGGDTVFVMNGTYHSTSGAILNIQKSGKAGAYITIKALKGHKPKITASGNVWNAVAINGSYIALEGLELAGNNANLTYEGAMAVYNEHINGGKNYPYYAGYNTNAITIGGPKKESKFPHHVAIRHCTVHDFPGGGINAIQADYVTIDNNVVFNNAWYMMYAGSGISILTPYNSDRIATYKNFIRNNIVSNNKTTVPWVQLKRLSDGNGIIIDVNQHAYSNQDATAPTAEEAYTGRTLVENNVSFNNGGSGIHSFKADHVDIINNTAYHNGTVMNYPDIFTNQCHDVKIINNIMYAREGGQCNSMPKNPTEIYANNIYFNGKVGFKGEGDVEADPQFVHPSTDHANADFKVKKDSPAIDQGSQVSGLYSQKDILGNSRPKGAAPDRGAYECTDCR
ncbi:right-handed parallel beta-helix repeat-containing protein [Dyadobacter sp. CY107]|uniref:choice-of-anchor Q domain-containing protein n=1 Tax=Dyadobacter fanqingshengii TaxID=2906443 RepID=UPI001F47D41D|nr:right-handed parallel beta-helix repeat-containing protein [Dyadobacter fanqingshengii]MCF2505241.1 right-handed parallel beta-helix repeat-containing protein [Dyadobacter fanqingshengii]